MIKSENGKIQLLGDTATIRVDAALLLETFRREGIYDEIIGFYEELLKDDIFTGVEVDIYDFKRPI